MRTGICFLLGVLWLSGSAWARPPEKEKPSAHFIKEGERLYQAGQYHEAAESLKKALQLEPNPRLVYNIARAYEQGGELTDALKYYQQYIGSTEGTDPVLLKRSSLALDRIRALLKQQDTARLQQEEERRKQAEQLRRAQERADADAIAMRKSEEERRAALGVAQQAYHRQKTEAYVVGGVAVVGLAVGVTFGILALQSKNQFTQAPDPSGKQHFQSVTQGRALAADIGYAVALAAAVTAVVLYPKGGAPSDARIAGLSIRPGGAGLEVTF